MHIRLLRLGTSRCWHDAEKNTSALSHTFCCFGQKREGHGKSSVRNFSVQGALALSRTASMQAVTPDAREKISVFQLVLLVLSLVVIGALITDAVAPVGKEVSSIIQFLDLTACLLFFVDFCVRFARAESKAEFMKWGWVDLVACIPNVDLFRFGRMVRVLRIIRLLRGVRVGHRIISVLLKNKPKTAFAGVLLTTLLLITFASISILIAEDNAEANIKTAEEAIWWSVTTITTVGYGDKFPTSTEGRIIAM